MATSVGDPHKAHLVQRQDKITFACFFIFGLIMAPTPTISAPVCAQGVGDCSELTVDDCEFSRSVTVTDVSPPDQSSWLFEYVYEVFGKKTGNVETKGEATFISQLTPSCKVKGERFLQADCKRIGLVKFRSERAPVEEAATLSGKCTIGAVSGEGSRGDLVTCCPKTLCEGREAPKKKTGTIAAGDSNESIVNDLAFESEYFSTTGSIRYLVTNHSSGTVQFDWRGLSVPFAGTLLSGNSTFITVPATGSTEGLTELESTFGDGTDVTGDIATQVATNGVPAISSVGVAFLSVAILIFMVLVTGRGKCRDA